MLTLRLASDGSGDLLLTVGGAAAGSGTIWRCSLDQQGSEYVDGDAARPFGPACSLGGSEPGGGNSGTSFFQYGSVTDVSGASSTLALMGSVDGTVRVQFTPSGPGGVPSGPAWQAPLHDMQEGRVTGVALSFDGAYLLSAAMDGTLYVQENRMPGGLSPATPPQEGMRQGEEEGVRSLADGPPPGADITDPAEYTLEEAKQKAERDALLAAAEAKKMGVRDYLAKVCVGCVGEGRVEGGGVQEKGRVGFVLSN